MQIKKIISKRIHFILLAILLISVGIFSAGKIFFSVKYSESDLGRHFTEYIQKHYNKSIKFESINIQPWGDIFIKGLHISHGSDFNDDLSLIESPETDIDLKLIDLIKGELRIEKILFKNPVINIHKQYGISYRDNIKKIAPFIFRENQNKVKSIPGIILLVKNGKFRYQQIFRDSSLSIKLSSVNGSFSISKNSLHYSFKGEILPHKSREITKGTFNIRGFFSQDELFKGTHKLILDDADISYCNEYIREFTGKDIFYFGSLSCDLDLGRDDKGLFINGELDTTNLSLSINQQKIIANENINSRIDLRTSSDFSEIYFNKLQISDDCLDLAFKGEALKKKEKWDKVSISLKTGLINLEKLSHYYFIPSMSYGGTFKADIDFNYDFKKDEPLGIKGHLQLSNGTLFYSHEGKQHEIFNKTGITVSINEKIAEIYGQVRSNKSDFKINSSTQITKWFPFKSETDIKIESNTIESELIWNSLISTVRLIYRISAEDRKRGYEEIYFRTKPAGYIVNNNEIIASITSKNILFGRRAKLDNAVLKFNLKNGVLSVEDFILEGYEGHYGLKLNAFFNRDYPRIEGEYYASGIQMEDFTNDLYGEPKMGGKLYISGDYELTAYRLSQLLENTRMSLNLDLKNGHIKNIKFLKKIEKMLFEDGRGNYDLSVINIRDAGLKLSQYADTFYISNFRIDGDLLSLRGYDKFKYSDPFSLTLSGSAINSNGKRQNHIFKINGSLFDPVFSLKGKDQKPISIFESN